MIKNYVMFVDERGFLKEGRINNFSMMGIVFEYNYCSDLGKDDCELTEKLNYYKKQILNSNDLDKSLLEVIQESFYLNNFRIKGKDLAKGLPIFFNGLKFNIILNNVKQYSTTEDYYCIAANNLLKNFELFLQEKRAKTGLIVVEDRNNDKDSINKQKFFNIYNNRDLALNLLEESKINGFWVSDKEDKIFKSGLEITNILNDILLKGYNYFNSNYKVYGLKDKFINCVQNKIYTYNHKKLLNNELIDDDIIVRKMDSKQIKLLNEKLNLKELKIIEQEKEIDKLKRELKRLYVQLDRVKPNIRKDKNILFKVSPEIILRNQQYRESRYLK